MILIPIILYSCALAPACAATQTALEDAARVRDEARLHCDAAISTLRDVEAGAAVVCAYVAVTPQSPARDEATAACDRREQLSAAVANVTRACGLVSGDGQ